MMLYISNPVTDWEVGLEGGKGKNYQEEAQSRDKYYLMDGRDINWLFSLSNE